MEAQAPRERHLIDSPPRWAGACVAPSAPPLRLTAMPTIESLPADQRAVLDLVLQLGRNYDDVAELLSMERAAVRDRALAALNALGPRTRVSPERRATEYLRQYVESEIERNAAPIRATGASIE